VREGQLSGAEGTLLASIDRHLADKGEGVDRFAYRILRGSLLLRRLAGALGGPAKQYLPLLRAYRESQERLVAELVVLEGRTEVEYNPDIGVKSIDAGDVRLARELGLPFPGTTTANKVLLGLVGTMIFGLPPGPGVELPRRVCFFKADAALLADGRKLMKEVQARIDRRAAQYRKRLAQNRQPVAWADDEQAAQTIDLVQSQAQVDVAAGQREEAIARLQGLLTRYPKARQFQETEAMIRAILDGSDKLPDGTPLVGCEDPR
jgi:hypothetical protein